MVIYWRRNPRSGTRFVNSIVNPTLLRRGLAGGRASEIGTIEHFGRTSGVRRLTPVHPEPTEDGFRIIVPLGGQSHWARNVLAAGHCRLQFHDVVYDLDEPAMVPAGSVDHLPAAVRRVASGLGFEYLRLRTFASNPGVLNPVESGAGSVDRAEPESAIAFRASEELVQAARP
jgi:deazaflavin-dependent oxidoreductase (nitroreductase family)